MIENRDLQNALNTPIAIPLIPFRNGEIDYRAHQKNIQYLMTNNHLSGGRPRVICIAGTSLIHHVDHKEQCALLTSTAEVMAGEGVLISAILPNPISGTDSLILQQAAMQRPPDAYLIMPLGGVYHSEGLYQGLSAFAERHGKESGARFLYYHRQPRDEEQVIRLMTDSDYFVGLKVGTSTDDVPRLVSSIRNTAAVIWGIGDRSSSAARLGTKGHTSGISVLFAKAGDMINNAQMAGKYEDAESLESRIEALEELRFMNARAYNYAAVLEAMILSGFADIDGGEGGPFNPRVPAAVSSMVGRAIDGLTDLH